MVGKASAQYGLKVGDRVALHHHVPCLKCHFCRHRAFAQCETYKRTGITAGFEPAGGGYAEYVRVMPFVLPGVVKIPARNSFEEGAMLEPVNTVLKAVKRLNLLRGDNVLVAGQGPIGLMFTKILRLRGINVLATDLLESRLKLAKKFGAKWTSLVGDEVDESLTKSRSKSDPRDLGLLRPKTLDAAIIAVPSDDAVKQALQLVRGGGQILLFAHTKRGAFACRFWRPAKNFPTKLKFPPLKNPARRRIPRAGRTRSPTSRLTSPPSALTKKTLSAATPPISPSRTKSHGSFFHDASTCARSSPTAFRWSRPPARLPWHPNPPKIP